MAYQKRNFQKEQLLTADDLNAMDDQIAANEKSANEAKTAATSAGSKAEEAKTTATSAESKAEEAKSTASNAKSVAEEAKNAAINAFGQKGLLSSSNNLNDVKSPGIYYWLNSSVPANSPFTCDCILIVYGSGGFVVQTAIDVVEPTDKAERVSYYNTWTPWNDEASGTSGMTFVRTLEASDDMNKIRETGIYSYFASGIPQNTPFGDQTTAVLVYVMSGEYLNGACPTLQVAVGDNNMMYRANHTTNDNNWGEWKDSNRVVEILQTSGTSENAVMSQKATTEYVQAQVEQATINVDTAIENASTAVELAAQANRNANDAIEAVETALHGKAELTSSDNIDIITDQGIYTWLNGSVPAGVPIDPEILEARSGMMMVLNYKDNQVQLVLEQYTSRVLTRTKMSYETKWSEWAYTPGVVQTTGGSDYKVMSQGATTEQINRLDARIDSIVTPEEGDSGADYSNVIQTLSRCFTNGVFVADDPDALKPTPGNGLQLITYPGTALINGYSKKMAKNTRTFNVKEEEYNEVYLLRLYTDTGEIKQITREVMIYGDLLLSKEDSAELPVRGGGWYDILLSKITLPAGATQITEDMITDYRSNDNYCGHVRSKV